MQNIRRQDCEEWKRNPLRNPLTGRAIQKGKGVYTELKRNCNDKYGITDDEKVNIGQRPDTRHDLDTREEEKYPDRVRYPENVKDITKQMNKLNLDTEPTNILPDSIKQKLLEQDRIYNEVPLLERIKEFRDLIWMNDLTEENFGKLFIDRINYYELFILNNIYIKDLILHNPYFIPTPQENYDVLFKALDHLYGDDDEQLKILSYYRQPEVYNRLLLDYKKYFGISIDYEDLVIKMFDALENQRRYPDPEDKQIFKLFVSNENNLKFSTSYIKISIKCLLNNYKELNRGYVITPQKIQTYLTIDCQDYIKFYTYLKKATPYPMFIKLREFLDDETFTCVIKSKECPKITTEQEKVIYNNYFLHIATDLKYSFSKYNPNYIFRFINCIIKENTNIFIDTFKGKIQLTQLIYYIFGDYLRGIQYTIKSFLATKIGEPIKEPPFGELIDKQTKEEFIHNLFKYKDRLGFPDLNLQIIKIINFINIDKGRLKIDHNFDFVDFNCYIKEVDLDNLFKYFFETFKLKLDFTFYISYIKRYPLLKKFKQYITKESIVQFLDRTEPTKEEVQEWRDLWAQQNPDDRNPPPPPDWWLRGRSADVHTKRHVAITDCRIKLLFERLPENLDIEKIADDIESETRRVATFLAKDDKLTGKANSDFIKNNTVTKQTILRCRLSENEYRLYGFGGVYEEQKVRSMNKEDQVIICSIVSKVWMVIKSTKSKPEMYNTLIMQFVGAFKEHIAQGVCNQGWVGGLTSIFGSYAKELGYLCLSEDEIEIEDLVQKFLDKSDNVKYPTVHKQFVEIGNVILEAKYDDEYLEEKHTDEEIANYKKKVQLYDDMYETPDIEVRKKAMTEFISGMVPSFFMEVFEYYPNEDIVRLKKATKKAVAEYLQIELDKICGTKRNFILDKISIRK
jgi:hypothetical protein